MIALIITVLNVFVLSTLLHGPAATRELAPPPLWLPYLSIALGALVSLIFHEGGHRTAGAIMG
jgi:hypothetical protein